MMDHIISFYHKYINEFARRVKKIWNCQETAIKRSGINKTADIDEYRRREQACLEDTKSCR